MAKPQKILVKPYKPGKKKHHLEQHDRIIFCRMFSDTCESVFSDEGPEKRERESLPGLLLGLLHVRSSDGALFTGKSAGLAEERGCKVRLDVQIFSLA